MTIIYICICICIYFNNKNDINSYVKYRKSMFIAIKENSILQNNTYYINQIEKEIKAMEIIDQER